MFIHLLELETFRQCVHLVFIWYRLFGINISKVPAERVTVKAVTQRDSVGNVTI